MDFGATWCGPCRAISPKFEEFSSTYTNAVFVSVDVDDQEDLAQRYNVSAMPTFKLFIDGHLKEEFKGANVQALQKMIETHN